MIFEEEERQRLRAKQSHIGLVRIQLMVDDFVDFVEAHRNITQAFHCCSTVDEHNELLSTMHGLLKEYASLKRLEMPLAKQILRNERGPIAEAHLGIADDDKTVIVLLLVIIENVCSTNKMIILCKVITVLISSLSLTIVYMHYRSSLAILLELEGTYPNSADIHEWLGYRYSEKSEFEAARHHFKRLREVLEPVPDVKDTLLLWGSSFNLLSR